MNISELHLRELYRFAELGRMSASLLHEISNPLSAAILNLEMSDQASPAVRRARNNMNLLRRYVEAARQQVRPGSPVAQFGLAQQISQLKHVLLPIAERAGVKLVFGALPSGYKLRGDQVKFQQILTNLVVNAIQAYDDYPLPGVRLVKIDFIAGSGALTIEVKDFGKGIAKADIPRLFDMFFTTKEATGLGLGLAIVKQYVCKDFKGSIKVTSSLKRGTRFVVKLKS